MPTKPLDRLIFAQGGLCFFCKQPLPRSEASVEHLVASVNGGNNADENCVACCITVNALLGRMSLKEKIQVVLNQKGQFRCPNGMGTIKTAPHTKGISKTPAVKEKGDKFGRVIANLKQRGSARPRTLKTLRSTVASLFPVGLSESELTALLQQLQTTGKIVIAGTKVTYEL